MSFSESEHPRDSEGKFTAEQSALNRSRAHRIPEVKSGVVTQSVSLDQAMQVRSPYSSINEDHVSRLVDQMKAAGGFVGEPIMIEHSAKGPWVSDGNHRLVAAQRAGLRTIPSHVYGADAGQLAGAELIRRERIKDESPL